MGKYTTFVAQLEKFDLTYTKLHSISQFFFKIVIGLLQKQLNFRIDFVMRW